MKIVISLINADDGNGEASKVESTLMENKIVSFHIKKNWSIFQIFYNSKKELNVFSTGGT